MHLACAGVLALVALAFGAPSAVPTTQVKAPAVVATTPRPAQPEVIVPPELYEQQMKSLGYDKNSPSRSRRGAGHAAPNLLYSFQLGIYMMWEWSDEGNCPSNYGETGAGNTGADSDWDLIIQTPTGCLVSNKAPTFNASGWGGWCDFSSYGYVSMGYVRSYCFFMNGYPGQICQMENPQDSGYFGGEGLSIEPYPFGISPFGSEAALFDTVDLGVYNTMVYHYWGFTGFSRYWSQTSGIRLWVPKPPNTVGPSPVNTATWLIINTVTSWTINCIGRFWHVMAINITKTDPIQYKLTTRNKITPSPTMSLGSLPYPQQWEYQGKYIEFYYYLETKFKIPRPYDGCWGPSFNSVNSSAGKYWVD